MEKGTHSQCCHSSDSFILLLPLIHLKTLAITQWSLSQNLTPLITFLAFYLYPKNMASIRPSTQACNLPV